MSGVVLNVVRNRTANYSVTITDRAGTPIELDEGDQVRIKIGQQGAEPLLDLFSGGDPTANGSACTRANPTILTIAEADTAGWAYGNYSVEVALVDASQDDLTKHAEYGIMVLQPNMLGNLGV